MQGIYNFDGMTIEEINIFLIQKNAELNTKTMALEDEVFKLKKDLQDAKGLNLIYRESLTKIKMLMDRIGLEISKSIYEKIEENPFWDKLVKRIGDE